MSTWKFLYVIRLALYLIALAASVREASAADIRPLISGGGDYRTIVIEGAIEPGDFDTFINIVRENQGKVSGVWLFSPGGDFYEAMKIGRAMRALELSSQAPMRTAAGLPECETGFFGPAPRDPRNCTCAGAAFFIHIGAVHQGGTFLAVHRPDIDKRQFARLPTAEAERAFNALQSAARDYMKEMGLTANIQDLVLNTASDDIRLLDDQTVKTYFWGDKLAYRHERMTSECARLTDTEREREKEYGNRILQTQGGSDPLSSIERADHEVIQKKYHEESKCQIALLEQWRTEAYERYFGIKRTDYGNENFAKWSEATKYLGRPFYELLAEENFTEQSLLGLSQLQRERTASAPAILLYDSDLRRKVVHEVTLISAGNPSSEFTRRLVESLDKTWGPHANSSSTIEWVWNNPAYSAKLKREPTSANGPFLALDIQGR